jgi:shikimate dehydrogenase
VCYDLNYHKASLPLKKRCADMDQPYVDGLGMLVEQAAASFYIWTGKRPDSRIVIDALVDHVS